MYYKECPFFPVCLFFSFSFFFAEFTQRAWRLGSVLCAQSLY